MVQRKRKWHATGRVKHYTILSTTGRKAGLNIFRQATSRWDSWGRRKPTKARKENANSTSTESSCSAHVLRGFFFFIIVIIFFFRSEVFCSWLFYSAWPRYTSIFFWDITERKERERRALTQVQYALKGDLRLFKGAHADRAMRGARKKEVPMELLQWTESAQVAPGYYLNFVELQAHHWTPSGWACPAVKRPAGPCPHCCEAYRRL